MAPFRLNLARGLRHLYKDLLGQIRSRTASVAQHRAISIFGRLGGPSIFWFERHGGMPTRRPVILESQAENRSLRRGNWPVMSVNIAVRASLVAGDSPIRARQLG